MQRLANALTMALGLLSFSAAAGAATLSIESDATTYGIGDTITITVTADSEGEVSADNYIQVYVAHDLSKVSADGILVHGQTFTQFDGALPALVNGVQDSCAWALGRENQCPAFDQYFNAEGNPVDAGAKIASFSYTADAAGIASFVFQDVSGGDFVFFSLGDAVDVGTAPAGISVTIVPEPGTGLLVLGGLLALARRRRGPA